MISGAILVGMDKPDIKALRRRLFSSLSEEEREEAGRILREYLDVCARIYQHSKLKKLIDRSPSEGDSTTDRDTV